MDFLLRNVPLLSRVGADRADQLRTDLAAAMAMELSVKASRRMTAERLAQRDPDGEVAGWLRSIGKLLNRY